AFRSTQHVFRCKWDLFQSDNPEINLLIYNSLKYYYTKHIPLRHFKVSIKAFKEFLRNKKLKSLTWSMRCVKNGIKQFLFRTSYNQIINKRRSFEAKTAQ